MTRIADPANFSDFARRVSEHDAWLTLSGSAIKMLTVMAGMKRNALGYIEASVSECSKASGLSRSAASRALIDLRKAGLLRAAPLGSFDNKHVRPSIWLITL